MRSRQLQLPGIPRFLEKSDYDEPSIFYEFDRAIDRLTRLYSFGYGLLPHDWGELCDRAERLAKDDLLNLAIHSRRFLTLAKAECLARNVEVPICKFTNDESGVKALAVRPGETIWRIINTIVHHDNLTIVDSSSTVKIQVYRRPIWEVLSSGIEAMYPVVIVSSDQVPGIGFELRYFVLRLYFRVFEPVIETLSNSGIYLEADLRDL